MMIHDIIEELEYIEDTITDFIVTQVNFLCTLDLGHSGCIFLDKRLTCEVSIQSGFMR